MCGGADIRTGIYECLVKCQACGYIFYPEIPALRPDELYNRNYFTGTEYLNYRSQQRTLAKNFGSYLRLMRRYGAGRGRLFEVGCAYGFFLNEARSYFDVEGIDVNSEAIAFGRDHMNLAVHCGEFMDFQPTSRYDVVCMWDTIEHLYQPGEFVAKAHEILVEGGYLFLTTGDIGSLVARLRGRKWRQIHPPTHLNYFSKATIGLFLNRIGFSMLGIQKTGTYKEINNLLYGLSLFSKKPLVRFLSRKVVERMKDILGHANLYVNLFDTMFVAARRG